MNTYILDNKTYIANLSQIFLLTISNFILLQCSNYTTYKVKPSPPILLSIKAIPSGHLITMRAANPDVFFAGYKLYVGDSESSVRNPSDLNSGTSCISLNLLPNLPIEYSIEISPNEGGLAPVEIGDNPNRVCKMIAELQSGKFIALRAITLSLQIGSGNLNFSPPSNTLLVP